MSDEAAVSPGFTQEDDDATAETQRDPRLPSERRLAPGVALSVLWFVEEEAPANDA
jgi:hypothetical protein